MACAYAKYTRRLGACLATFALGGALGRAGMDLPFVDPPGGHGSCARTEGCRVNQNPSSWPRRIPVFGAHSNEAVLTSSITRLPPLPDATLGALAYVVEAIVTIVGGSCRWRTAPWLVIVYGLVLAGLALTSLVLVLMQIFLVHALDPMHWELLPHNLGLPGALLRICGAALPDLTVLTFGRGRRLVYAIARAEE